MIYIDTFSDYNKMIGRAGPRWSHMIADTHAELLAFATKIGLNPKWIQKPGTKWEHFDIGSQGIRDKAVALGAVELTIRELSLKMAEREVPE